MKHVFFSLISASILIAGFLIGGCNSGTDQPSNQADTDEIEVSSLPELMVQMSDSLLFIRANPSDQAITFQNTPDTEPFIAFSIIDLTKPIREIKTYGQGSELHLSLDENLTVTARINRNQPIGENIRTLTGPLLNPHTGYVTLAVNEKSVTGTIDLLSENRLFYIRYNSASGFHYLAEIDRTKLDIQEGSQPLEMN